MSIVVIATIQPLDEHRPAVREVLIRGVARTRDEDSGCELYALHENGDRFVMVEKWSDRDALDRHLAGSAFTDIAAGLRQRLAHGPDMQILSAVDTGPGDGRML